MLAANSQIDETKVKKMKATEIKNYQNLTAKDIVSYMKNNNISTITSGKIEYSVDDIEDSWEYILVVFYFCCFHFFTLVSSYSA